MNITNLYMVRHAESPFVFGEERTRGLSEDGLRAAIKVADVLEREDIDLIASSGYERSKQTVLCLAERKNLPILEYEELRERPIKGLHYKAPWEELVVAIEKSFKDLDYALDGGESTRYAQERAIPVIKGLLDTHKGKNIVIGTHGNIMTIIMNYFDPQYGFEFWKRATLPDIYKLSFLKGQLLNVERLWESSDTGKH